MATILVILALAALPLLTPIWVHRALDAAGSASFLSLTPEMTKGLSDRSVSELLTGPGTFAFAGPDGRSFYDEAERGHLADARALLWLLLISGAVAVIVLAALLASAGREQRRQLWRSVAGAGASAVIVTLLLGFVSLVAFESLFELFHRIAFPGGGWSFDPSTQRLVQLYPFGFWQLTAAAFATLIVVLGTGAWVLGRWRSSRASSPTDR